MTENLKRIDFSPPDVSELEIEEVTAAIRSGWITTGPRTKLLEKNVAEYIGVRKAVCLNSATAALELTLRILGIGPGDEVISSAYTYSASAAIIHHVGAKIVLVDVSPGSYEMDYKKMEEAITARTKAIIPIDIAGKMCDYDAMFAAIESKKPLFTASNPLQKKIGRIAVVSDAAHAFGATRNGHSSGTVADFTCFSFHAVKNFTTAEGGAVTWRQDLGFDDEQLYRQYMLYSLHGQSKDALAKSQLGSWEYDIIFLGYKFNMTDVLASIGLKQLERYEALLAKRREIVSIYEKLLADEGIDTLKHSGESFLSTHHLYMVRVPGIDEAERNELITLMGRDGVACNVHYKPLPMLTAYRNLDFKIEDFPYAYEQYRNEITLPLHTKLTREDVEYVAKQFIYNLEKVRGEM